MLSPRKFNQFIFYPDLATKFMITSSVRNILSFETFTVVFKTIFTNSLTYGSFAIKVFLILESIYPQRCLSNSRLIVLRFRKARCHSTIYLQLTFNDLISFYLFFVKKPVFTFFIGQTKHFVFPGYIKVLMPLLHFKVNLEYNNITNKKIFLFYKTAFID